MSASKAVHDQWTSIYKASKIKYSLKKKIARKKDLNEKYFNTL